MTAFIVALCAALTLAFLRLAATAFEAAVYHFANSDYKRSFQATLQALLFVLCLATVVTPVVRLFNSFEVLTIETPAIEHSPKGSNGVRV